MQYAVQIEDVSLIRRRLHISLDPDVVKQELDSAFRNLRNRVRLPGFRQGKVPRNVLEARFGRQVKAEVGNKLVDRVFKEASAGLDLVGQPALEDRGEIAQGAPFTFTIGVDVRPAVEVTGYRGIEVGYVARQVDEEDVDRVVNARLAARARIEVVTEDRPVEKGDLVLTELELRRDGNVAAVEAGTAVNTSNERYYPGVEALLLGMVKGEEKTATVRIGSGAHIESLRDLEFEARVKVLEMQRHAVPTLTDEVAAELGYEGGAEGMRASVRLSLQQVAEESDRNDARVKLLQKLAELNRFEVPAGLVEEQFLALVEELKVRRSYAGQDERSFRLGEDERIDLRHRARFAAQASVILSAVARQEGIAVTDDDMGAKIREIADLRSQAPAAIRGYLEREGAMPVLQARILEEKTLAWLIENAVLVPIVANPAEPVPADAAPAPYQSAEVVEAPVESAPEEAASIDTPTPEAPAASPPAWNESMKKNDLLEIAGALGLELAARSTKAEILAALEATR